MYESTVLFLELILYEKYKTFVQYCESGMFLCQQLFQMSLQLRESLKMFVAIDEIDLCKKQVPLVTLYLWSLGKHLIILNSL